MTSTGSSLARTAVAVVLALGWSAVSVSADTSALNLRAIVAAPDGLQAPLTIELLRWSTDAERAPLLTALAPPPPAPPAPPAAAGGTGRGGRAAQAGRGGRGGRGGAPASPIERMATAIKGAPTVGFVWSDGVTGHSIKYAWRSPAAGAPQRVVLVLDRRLGAHVPGWPTAAGPLAEADFTVLELRLDQKGAGEGKASLTTSVVVDAATQTLALDGYSEAPLLLKVIR